MKGLVLGLFSLVLMQACDLSPDALLGGKERGADPYASDSVQPVSMERTCESPTPYLKTVRTSACSQTSSSHSGFGSLDLERLDVSADGRKLFVRFEGKSGFGATVPVSPELHVLEYREAATGGILRFACSLEMNDLYGCKPACRLSAAKADSQVKEDCVALNGDVSLAENVEGKGAFVAYRIGIRNPTCSSEEYVFGDLKALVSTSANSVYCDQVSHERKTSDGVTLPSLDWAVPPASGE